MRDRVASVDLSAPIADVVAPQRAAVLAALLRLREPVTGRELAAQAAVPPATTARLLDDLADAGLVDRRPAGRAVVVALNRRHLAIPALEQLVTMRARLVELVRSTIAQWEAVAVAGWMFGSAARGDGDRHSDIDILVVARGQPASAWEEQIAELAELTSVSTGNNTHVLDYSQNDFLRLIAADNPLVRSLRSEGIELVDGSTALLRAR
jgi:predicted nucleotidyltransferase